jgi:putative membrane protein
MGGFAMMNRTKWWLAPIFSAAALGFGCQSQGNSTGSPSSASPTTSPQSGQTGQTGQATQASATKLDDATKTRIVLTELHSINQQEINEGKLAADRAQSADVKKFASDMVTDHTNADQKLTDLAKRMEIDIHSSPTNPVEAAMSQATDERKRMLSGLSGPAFDIAFIAPEAHEHELALQIIDQGQKSASGDVKRLLDEVKPTVESHREHAKALLKGLRFDSSAVGGGPAGGSRSSMEGADQGGRNDMRGTTGIDTSAAPGGARHDAGVQLRHNTTGHPSGTTGRDSTGRDPTGGSTKDDTTGGRNEQHPTQP